MNNPIFASSYVSAAQRVLDAFCLSDAKLIPYAQAENLTFKLMRANGSEFALRLHRPNYNTLEDLESERAWTAALLAAGVLVQSSVFTADGAPFVTLSIPEVGESRFAGVTTWLEGEVLSDFLESDSDRGQGQRLAVFRAMGELAAVMHNQAERWTPPRNFQRPRLGRKGLLGDEPRWGCFWEHAALSLPQREWMQALRAELREELRMFTKTPQNFGLIHADLHPGNLLVTTREPELRLGVIDFDDAAFGWHMYDIAAALFEFQDAVDFAELVQAMLDGYRSQRPLPDGDAATLPTFLRLRALAFIGWLHQRPDYFDADEFARLLRWLQ